MVSYNQISDEEFKALSPALSKDIVYTTDLLENILHWSRSQLKGFGINKEYFNIRNIILNEINYHLLSASLKKHWDYSRRFSEWSSLCRYTDVSNCS